MSGEFFNAIITVVGFGVVAAGAVMVIMSSSHKQAAEDLKSLVASRGERIDDLETRIVELESHILRLEGKVSAMAELKTEQIATAVVELLEPLLVNGTVS